MTIQAHFRCDTCGNTDNTHPDDGPPAGWFLVALMEHDGCWSQERHHCSVGCLARAPRWGGEAVPTWPTANLASYIEEMGAIVEWLRKRGGAA